MRLFLAYPAMHAIPRGSADAPRERSVISSRCRAPPAACPKTPKNSMGRGNRSGKRMRATTCGCGKRGSSACERDSRFGQPSIVAGLQAPSPSYQTAWWDAVVVSSTADWTAGCWECAPRIPGSPVVGGDPIRGQIPQRQVARFQSEMHIFGSRGRPCPQSN